MSDPQQTNLMQPVPPSTAKRGSFSSWRGNKYPQVKLRGFYSDITSTHNSDKAGVNYSSN